MADDGTPIKHYKVTLKSGDFGIFSNDNRFDNYPDRLVSGMYGVSTATQNLPITRDTVASIDEVNVCDHCGKEVQRTGSFDCPHCGKRTFVAVSEHNS
jgi:DNA-directed RNA polymerase subunit RPC12/RpoP